MEPMEDRANFFTVKIPKQSSASYLYFWMVATDNMGKKTTSPAYALKVEDMDQANLFEIAVDYCFKPLRVQKRIFQSLVMMILK